MRRGNQLRAEAVHEYTVTSTNEPYPEGLRTFFSSLVASGSVAPAEGEALIDSETGSYLYEGDVSGDCPYCRAGTGGNICEVRRAPT